MSTKATYVVPNKTQSAQEFDARPQLGTGGMKLLKLREAAPGHADVIDAVWHLASHVNGIVLKKEKESGLITYAEANPPKDWGRATIIARDTMTQKMDPKRIITSKQF